MKLLLFSDVHRDVRICKRLVDMSQGIDIVSGILITHSPPYGVVDKSSSGQNLGSTSIRDIILKKHPVLVVCGHIHESSGKYDKLGRSVVINAGPEGVIWDI